MDMRSKPKNLLSQSLICTLTLAFLTGCGPAVIGNGKVVTISQQVAEFTQVVVAGSVQLVATTGELSELTITGEENMLALHDWVVRDGVLRLQPKQGQWLNPTQPITATISVPRLEAVQASGSAVVTAAALVSPSAASVETSGSARVISGPISAPQVNLEASGASEIQTEGATTALNISASGSADIVAAGLMSEVLELSASGSCTVKARASKEARGDASGAAHVVVEGSPGVRSIARSGSTSVSFP